MSDLETLNVDLPERGYPILVGDGLVADAGRHIAPILAQPRVITITDENVAKAALADLNASLDGAGVRHEEIILPAGERTKDYGHLMKVVDRVLDMTIDRKVTLIALGGGVIGDLTGFVAAITLRGLGFIQIPTTLLAQVDSSVGGKTGINTRHGKNLVGAFHQPRMVLADTGVLSHLPIRELKAGYAEIVKYGLIDHPGFFSWLEKNGQAVLDGDAAARRYAVLESCRAKAAIVAKDEREQGARALLNLGHTFGHALEVEAGYGDKLLHGEAVSIGMMMAFRLSTRMDLCPANDTERALSHLKTMDLPHDLSGLETSGWTSEKLLAHMSKDKKANAGEPAFILARGIGKSFVTRDVKTADVAQVLEEFLASA